MATERKGNSEVRETWRSGEVQRAGVDRITVINYGRKDALELVQPSAGNQEWLAGYTVESSVVRPQRGGMGELSVYLVETDTSTGIGVPEGALDATIEIEMAQVEMPLMSHPDFEGYAPEIECWRSETVAATRAGLSYTNKAGQEVKLKGKAEDAAKKILRGVESYLRFAPVVTRTTTYKTRPDPKNIDKVCAPPASVPGTWDYLKTGDSVRQIGKKRYERTEQWTGVAGKWDRDLYEVAT